MMNHNSLSPERRNPQCRPVIGLPVRLYQSGATIFELYDGGKLYQPMAIRWKHLESIEGMDTQPPQFHRRLEDKQ